MSKLSEEDKSLFAAAMQDVEPLGATPKTSEDLSRQQRQKRKQTLKQLSRRKRGLQEDTALIEIDEPVDSVSAFESLLFHRKGIRLQDLARLKKGDWPIDARLDLHGLTEDTADQTLQRFIQRSTKQGDRCVLVIHGKGYNSETGQPVLKNLVNRRLRQLDSVLAFATTPPRDGGTGSVYVLLKSTKNKQLL